MKASDLWEEFLTGGHCGLCGNTGYIDTRGIAITPAGLRCGIRAYCICPNGRALKKASKRLGAREGGSSIVETEGKKKGKKE